MPKILPKKTTKSSLRYESFPGQYNRTKRYELSDEDYESGEEDPEYFESFFDKIKKSTKDFTKKLEVEFPRNQFKIERTNKNKYKILDLDGNQECLNFRIHRHFDEETEEDKGLFIDSDFTSKCNISATESIQRLIRFAEKNGFSGYTVSDESHLEFQCPGNKRIDISLGTLNTLATGQSWYNKFGFIPDDNEYPGRHETNLIRNANFIKTPIRNFLQNLKDKEHALEEERIIKESKNLYFNLYDLYKIQSIQQQFQDLLRLFSFTEHQDKSIQEFFAHIKNVMRDETNFCTDRYEVLNNFLINLDDEFLGLHEYPERLTKKIQSAGKRTKKRRKNLKHKNTKKHYIIKKKFLRQRHER